ncbi:hypothetical protein NKI38_19145 [Mesorhizobium sp. M0621]|uniref:hypothetical protein n=1 Tax=Mesorhizobium sp. M0621 TaxID=2956974 RepID=UPI00333C9F4F
MSAPGTLAGWMIVARPCRLTLGIVKDDAYRLWRPCLLLFILALAACSSSEHVPQQSKIAASASRTAAMVLDAWAAGAAPSHYVSATLQSTAETLAEAGQQMQADNSPQSSESRGVIAAIGQLSAAVRRAQAGVEAGNPRQVSQARQELGTAATDLAAFYGGYVAPKS